MSSTTTVAGVIAPVSAHPALPGIHATSAHSLGATGQTSHAHTSPQTASPPQAHHHTALPTRRFIGGPPNKRSANTGPVPPQDPETAAMEKYVRLAATSADEAKIRYRNELKLEQKQRENDAKQRGEPLSARDKERERSRRESSVTRRRAEVYVAELETIARKLPHLEDEITILRRQLDENRAALAASQGMQVGHGQSGRSGVGAGGGASGSGGDGNGNGSGSGGGGAGGGAGGNAGGAGGVATGPSVTGNDNIMVDGSATASLTGSASEGIVKAEDVAQSSSAVGGGKDLFA